VLQETKHGDTNGTIVGDMTLLPGGDTMQLLPGDSAMQLSSGEDALWVLPADVLTLPSNDAVEQRDIILTSLSEDMIDSQLLSPSKKADMGDLSCKPGSVKTLVGKALQFALKLPASGVTEALSSELVMLANGDSAQNVFDKLHSPSQK